MPVPTPPILDTAQVATWGRVWRSKGKPVAVVNIQHGFHAGHQSLLRQAHLLPGAKVLAAVHAELSDELNSLFAAAGVDAIYQVPVPSGTTLIQAAPVFHGDANAWDASTFGRGFGESGQDVTTLARRTTALVRVAITSWATDIFAGEDDYEQLVWLTQASHDLGLAVRVHGVPVVRHANGLAVSSSNAYLAPEFREQALALGAALTAGAHCAEHGVEAVVTTVVEVLNGAGVTPDYIFVRARNWDVPPTVGDARLVVGAHWDEVFLCDSVGLAMGTGFKQLNESQN
ncbi:MAG: pantoate--beta-alanine ligase [Corynebacterium sp.]|nr:pantoate--beta-alanine ligase [Corynebacterium sp.]